MDLEECFVRCGYYGIKVYKICLIFVLNVFWGLELFLSKSLYFKLVVYKSVWYWWIYICIIIYSWFLLCVDFVFVIVFIY